MYDAIILAGGDARRLGGVDKPALEVAGASLLDRCVAAVASAERIVVVGPERAVSRPVIWCREQPPGGGPVAAVAAGLAHVDSSVVMVLASDLPFVGPGVPLLLQALASAAADCAELVDASGRSNHLAAAWRRVSLADALDMIGDPAGASMRSLVEGVDRVAVADTGGWGRDCDTWDDLAAAREEIAMSDACGAKGAQ